MRSYFFVGTAGPGTVGAEDPGRCRTFKPGVAPFPFALVATTDNEIDVTINTIAEIVVAFESSVAEPRGPNAVCEPMPPNAPARSAALPLCSSTTIIKNRQTTT